LGDEGVSEKQEFILNILPYVGLFMAIGVVGWVVTTWMRIKNGYPLENSWGMPIHPKTDQEAAERIKILTNENAKLRTEIKSVTDRLANVERIVTDQPSRLMRDIDALAIDKEGTR
jgi:hypothetical protein